MSGGARSTDELLAVEYITADEYRKPLPRTKPLPLEHELPDAECHNCGEPWNDGDGWDERHLHGGASAGETWKYECPNCGFETFECGT
jgi:Zn finger protein HypA/HybF involved in hydrogenase expression